MLGLVEFYIHAFGVRYEARQTHEKSI